MEEYFYAADRLTGLDLGAGAHPFSYDSRGRTLGDYTPHGGQRITYNNYLNRVSATSSVNFSYLADGEKTCSLTKEGEVGLVYRGPFVFRQSSGGVRELEGVLCPEGKLTTNMALVYIKDYIGNVVMVMDGHDGSIKESSIYDAYGRRQNFPQDSVRVSQDITVREHFTGKEDQMPEFGIDYTDFGARLYSPTVRRWLTPDPLSEKYYGISPYAYCAGNPTSFVDRNGRDSVYVFDINERPHDEGIKGETYSAILVVVVNGFIRGEYRGSSYPNSVSPTNNAPAHNTVNEGWHMFNNKFGHDESKQYGLNLVNERGERKTSAKTPEGRDTMATLINVHIGYSDNGGYQSRGSKGCITVHPDDADIFFLNFQWVRSVILVDKHKLHYHVYCFSKVDKMQGYSI